MRQSSDDFDRLPIPFRAIATDLANADMVELRRGSLSAAIRASMSIPAAVSPVEIDGRLLVDGGMARNLPVDVARAMGAERIIAVNIGTPPLRRDQIGSLLSVSDQITRFLTAKNVAQSLSELGPDDVLITPELGTITAGDFDRLAEAAAAGEKATLAQAAALAPMAIDAQAYAAFEAVRTQDARPREVVISELQIEGTRRTREEVVRAAMVSQPGSVFDADTAEADMRRLYGLGDFEHVSYALVGEPSERQVLTTTVSEKRWGPHYLRFGLGLQTSFDGNAYFTLRATHRATWLNALGGEWRNDLQIGHTELLRTEWHQPLTVRQRVFATAHLQALRSPFDVYDEGLRVARFRWDRRELAMALGAPLGSSAEVRLGLVRGRAKLLTDTSVIPGALLSPDRDTGGVQFQLRYDSLDNLRFPRSGWLADANVYASRSAFGAEDTYTRLSLDLRGAVAVGNHVLRLAGAMQKRIGGTIELPGYELTSLGGFLRLSGYHIGEFIGQEMRFARAVYALRIAGPGFLDGAYVGVSAEAGRIGDTAGRGVVTRHGNAIYLNVDTLLGPVYLAYGRASSQRDAFYFFLGRP